ncbi:MAG: hypothetical protein KDI44_18405 [Thiothrix sp.]|nr:hypothetical protein [Thiothrix sp.]HPQ95863.1 hypothetical protein [Thiolinea sp.]
MKAVFPPLLLILIILLQGCEDRYSPTRMNDLKLHYHTAAEARYIDISLEQGRMDYTFLPDADTRCAHSVRAGPCWNRENLQTLSRPLEQDELEQLYQTVQDSGILTLSQDAFGETDRHRRAYVTRLQVSTGGRTRDLVYRSNPQAAARPPAFARLEQALLEQAQRLQTGNSTAGQTPPRSR